MVSLVVVVVELGLAFDVIGYDENRDSPERDMVDPPSEDSYVASSERTLDS